MIVHAGVDTTAGSILWFLCAMILYPDVQSKAQSEMDRTIGGARLPTLEE